MILFLFNVKLNDLTNLFFDEFVFFIYEHCKSPQISQRECSLGVINVWLREASRRWFSIDFFLEYYYNLTKKRPKDFLRTRVSRFVNKVFETPLRRAG